MRANEDSDLDEDNRDDDGYGDVHRMVLQGFMNNGFLGAAGVRELFKQAWLKCDILNVDAAEEMNLIATTVKEINGKIARFNFVIKTAISEFTGKVNYMFTITVDSQLMRLQTYFSKVEIDLFKKCLEKLMSESSDFTIGVAEFLNLALELEKVNVSQAEVVMNKMLQHHYFEKYYVDEAEEDFNLTLGIRSVLELDPVISQSYPGALSLCQLCRKIMLHGFLCRKCPYTLHIYCYKKYIKNRKECPDCKQGWTPEDKMLRRKNNMVNETEAVDTNNVTADETLADGGETPAGEDEITEEDMDTQPTPRPRPLVRTSRVVSSDSGENTDEC